MSRRKTFGPFMQQRGLDPEGLARLSGVSARTINTIRAGRTIPSGRVMILLAKALKARPEFVFGLILASHAEAQTRKRRNAA